MQPTTTNDAPSTPQTVGAAALAVMRFTVVAAAALWMVFALFLIGGGVGGYAIHLCGWPAQIACDTGSTVWWLVPVGAGLVALAGTGLLVLWAWRRDRAFRFGLAHPLWFYSLGLLITSEGPRDFSVADLIVYGAWGGIGIELVRGSALAVFPSRRRTIHTIVTVAWAVYLAILLAVPSLLEAAAAAD